MTNTNHACVCTVQIQKKTDKSPEKLIKSLPFSKQVQIICQKSRLSRIKVELNRPLSFRVTTTLLSLLNKEFLNTYIVSRRLAAFSSSSLDRNNSLAFNNGILYLSIDETSYSKSGIIGKKSHKNDGKYFIELDMIQLMKKTDSKILKRLENAASGPLNETFIVNMTISESDDEKDEIKNNLEKFLKPLKIEEIGQWTEKQLSDVLTPCFDPSLITEGATSACYKNVLLEEWAANLYEWIGMVSLDSIQIRKNHGVDQYLSQYEVFDAQSVEDLMIFDISGIFSNEFLNNLWTDISTENESFLVLQVYGVENGVIGFNCNEHRRGEVGYSVIALENDEDLMIKLTTKL